MQVTQLQFKDGDDDQYDNETYNTIITSCDNGYLVTIQSDEGDSVMVFEYKNGREMMKYLADKLGVE